MSQNWDEEFKGFERNPAHLDGTEDMSNLIHMDGPHILYNMWVRYMKDEIYTSISRILIAVNPYKRIDMYGGDLIELYREEAKKARSHLAPHVFSISQVAYHQLLTKNENQSMIVCGESGSGKTESAKHLMRYLAYSPHNDPNDTEVSIEEQVLQCNPIMESFGNAKTVLNNNSSRFGKFTKIVFGEGQKKIIGSLIDVYLLEKTRVVRQVKNERNYHAFYLLTTGAKDQPFYDELKLRDPTTFYYLNQGDCVTAPGIDDVRWFHELDSAMDSLHFTDKHKMDVFRLTAGILHLGDVNFVPGDGTDDVKISPDSADLVKFIAELFEVELEPLVNRLETSKLIIRGNAIVKHYNLIDAEANRDSIAKAVYDGLFNNLVKSVNHVLFKEESKSNDLNWIGILDVFGFENFVNNSFEQFCINFANENLQMFFNEHIIKNEQDEYMKEGILWTPIKAPDNSDVIHLIDSRPQGIYSILDSSCRMPRADHDTFLQNLFSSHRYHPKLKRVTQKKGKTSRDTVKFSGFNLIHYAGSVQYDCTDFLHKNIDSIHNDTVKLFGTSKSEIASVVLAEDTPVAAAAPAKGRARRTRSKTSSFQSTGSVFRTQLAKLMLTLKQTTPYFVRCIKPNVSKVKGVFEKDYVRPQLECSGLIEALRILKLGYPSRTHYSTIFERYGHVVPKGDAELNQRDFCEAVLLHVGETLKPSEFQLGLSKCFFKPGKQAFLEDLLTMDEIPADVIRKIQVFLVMKRFKRVAGSIGIFNVFAKKLKKSRAKTQIKNLFGASKVVTQTMFKYLQQQRVLIATKTIQAYVRGYNSRIEHKNKKEAVNVIADTFANQRFRNALKEAVSEKIKITRARKKEEQKKRAEEQRRLQAERREKEKEERRLAMEKRKQEDAERRQKEKEERERKKAEAEEMRKQAAEEKKARLAKEEEERQAKAAKAAAEAEEKRKKIALEEEERKRRIAQEEEDRRRKAALEEEERKKKAALEEEERQRRVLREEEEHKARLAAAALAEEERKMKIRREEEERKMRMAREEEERQIRLARLEEERVQRAAAAAREEEERQRRAVLALQEEEERLARIKAAREEETEKKKQALESKLEAMRLEEERNIQLKRMEQEQKIQADLEKTRQEFESKLRAREEEAKEKADQKQQKLMELQAEVMKWDNEVALRKAQEEAEKAVRVQAQEDEWRKTMAERTQEHSVRFAAQEEKLRAELKKEMEDHRSNMEAKMDILKESNAAAIAAKNRELDFKEMEFKSKMTEFESKTAESHSRNNSMAQQMEKMSDFESKYNDLKPQVDEWRNKFQAKNNEYDLLQGQFKMKGDGYDTKHSQLVELQAQHKASQKELGEKISELTAELRVKQENYDSKHLAFESTKGDLRVKEMELKVKTDEYLSKVNECQAIKDEIKVCHQDIATLKAQFEAHSREKDSKEGELKREQSIVAVKDEQLVAKDEEIQVLKDEIKALKKEVDAKQSDADTKRVEAETRAGELKVVEMQFKVKEEQLETVQKDFDNQKIELQNIKAELKVVSEDKHTMYEQLEAKTQELDGKSNEMKMKEFELKSKSDELDSMKRQLSTSEEKLKTAEERVTKLTEDFGVKKGEYDAKIMELDHKEGELTVKKMEMKVKEDELSTHVADLTNVKAELKDSQHKNIELQNKVVTMEGQLSELNYQMKDKQQSNKHLDEVTQDLQDKNAKLEEQITSMRSELQISDSKMSEIKADNKILMSSREEFVKSRDAEAKEIRQQLEARSMESREYSHELAVAQAKLTQRDYELVSLKERVQESTTESKTMMEQLMALKIKISLKEAEMEQKDKTFGKLEVEHKEYSESLTTLKIQLAQKDGELTNKEQSYNNTLQELEKLKKQSTDSSDNVKDLRDAQIEVKSLNAAIHRNEESLHAKDHIIEQMTEKNKQLLQQLTDVQIKLGHVDGEGNVRERQMTKITEELNQLREHVSELKVQISVKDSSIAYKDEQLTKDSQELKSLKESLSQSELNLKSFALSAERQTQENKELANLLEANKAKVESLEEANKELHAVKKQITKAAKDMAARSENTGDHAAPPTDDVETMQENTAAMQALLDSKQQTLEELHTKMTEQSKKFNEQTTELQHALANLDMVQKDLVDKDRQLAAAEGRIMAQSEDMKESLRSMSARMNKRNAEAQQAAGSQIDGFRAEMAGKDTTLREVREQLMNTKIDLRQVETEMKWKDALMIKQKKESADLEAKMEKMTAEKEAEITEHKLQIKKIEKEVYALKATITQLKGEIEMYLLEVSSLKMEHEASMNHIKLEHETEISHLNIENDTKINTLKLDHDNKMNAVIMGHSEALREKAHMEEQYDKLKMSHAEDIKLSTAKMMALSTRASISEKRRRSSINAQLQVSVLEGKMNTLFSDIKENETPEGHLTAPLEAENAKLQQKVRELEKSARRAKMASPKKGKVNGIKELSKIIATKRIVRKQGLRRRNMSISQQSVALKVGIMGDPGIGKTSLMLSAVKGRFVDGATCKSNPWLKKLSRVPSHNMMINLTIWDIGHENEVANNMAPLLKNVHCLIVMFDLTDLSTLENVDKWHKRVIQQMHSSPGDTDIPSFILCGSKFDVLARKSEAEIKAVEDKARHVASSIEAPIVFTSAKGLVNLYTLNEVVFNMCYPKIPVDTTKIHPTALVEMMESGPGSPRVISPR